MEKKREFFIECCQSKNGTQFLALKCDLGYRVVVVSFDTGTVVELSGLDYQKAFELKVGDKLPIKL